VELPVLSVILHVLLVLEQQLLNVLHVQLDFIWMELPVLHVMLNVLNVQQQVMPHVRHVQVLTSLIHLVL
jgi:hypothetical protein